MEQRIGKYKVEKQLGAGSFGNVYLALHPHLQKRVAIKKLKTQPHAAASDPQADTGLLFTREAVETSKLAHPNIVTVHDFDIDAADKGPYMVMEFLEGQTLEKVISKKTNLTLFEKIELMQQVAEGLQFAHSRGVIHRDIKPANIMILSDGTAKVMDFAVAPEGYVIGTPAYMAPEQLAGTADAMTDVFGFGAVYYELLTGNRPFGDPQKEPERATTSHYEPPHAATVVEGCPPWLDLLITRLMAKRREKRIFSLEEMLTETRPIVQKLRQERAAELAGGISPLMKAGKREDAVLLSDRVLRLDPLNREARTYRDDLQSGQREQARARAKVLMQQGQAIFDDGDFEAAREIFEQALALDFGNAGIEKSLADARVRAEDRRFARLLLDEVLDDIVAAGAAGLLSWQAEHAFVRVSRATRLDPASHDARTLFEALRPVYEEACDRRQPSGFGPARTSAGQPEAWYEKRLKEAARARRDRKYDYALEILNKLQAQAPDDRVKREISAVTADITANRAAEDVLRRAGLLKFQGDVENAKRLLDDFAEQYPRHARRVEEERRAMEREMEGRGELLGRAQAQ